MRAARATVVVPCVCVCVCVCVCICMYVSTLFAASHIEITKERYQQIHRNTRFIFNFADFLEFFHSNVMA